MPSTASPAPRAPSKLPMLLVAVTFVALTARMFHLIATHAVNLLWWDEWNLYRAFMQHVSWGQLFRWEHTAQREGISFILVKWLADATAWNSKDVAYFVALFVVLNAALALALKRKLIGPIRFADLLIPLIFLTPMQYESFLGPSVPAFSSFPVLLVLLCCLAWLIEGRLLRYGCVLVVNFLAVYSGFGLFLGFVVPALFVAEILRSLRNGERRDALLGAAGFAICAASLISFFVGFVFMPAADCFRFPLHPFYGYPWFAALMLANPFRLKGHGPLATIIGSFLLIALLWLLLRRFAQLWQKNSPPELARTSSLLFGFAFLYIASAAIGRLCFGVDAAQPSRYVIFVSVAIFAFYMEALAAKHFRTRRAALCLLAIGLLAGNFYPDHRDTAQVRFYFETKSKWKQCYLRYEDIVRCDAEAGGPAYPNPAAIRLKEKLDYLKANRLNLFNGQ